MAFIKNKITKQISNLLVIAVAMLLISACSTNITTNNSSTIRPYLDHKVQTYLPKAHMVPVLELQELLEINYRNQSHSLIVLFKSDGQSVTLTGVSHLGIKLFSATYSDQGLQTQKFINIEELPTAEQVLLDVLLGHVPVEVWQDYLPQGYSLTQKDNKRVLTNDKAQLIYELELANKFEVQVPTKLTNYNFGYQISISYL